MKQWFKYAALAAILTTFLGYFSTSVWDMDFWWHIATGRNIVETHSIPEYDPFSMYSSDSLRSDLILKGNWLAQVVFFYIFDGWGANGIFLLKAGILMLCLAIVYIRSVLFGASGLSAMLVLSCAGMMLLHFTGDRPQLFSFLFFALAILLLDINAFSWGGYSNWLLYPQSKAFIDGRVLDKRSFRDSTHILWATPYGIRQLESYQFDYVLIQNANVFTGEEYKPNDYLLHNPQWQVGYRDQLGYLFARMGASPQ